MDVIHDQRHIYGGTTPDDVKARWVRILRATNEARTDRGLPLVVLTPTGLHVDAYVNQGRWVASCVCGGGMGCWPDHVLAACLDCGRVYTVRFPPADVRRGAERVLLARPVMGSRNWTPGTETVGMLAAENRVHL